jgi:hydrogenase maturation protease
MGRRVVVCLGNLDRGDDAAGRKVANMLRETASPGVEIMELGGEATALLEAIDGAAEAILVDACVSGAPPGTILRFDVASAPLPQAGFGGSTHGLGLAVAVELARALGRLPPVCVVYAVEGESFALGAPLSPRIAAATAKIAHSVWAELLREPLCEDRSSGRNCQK